MAKKRGFVVLIPECPAAEKCRELKADCKVCEELSDAEWRKHVQAVLSH